MQTHGIQASGLHRTAFRTRHQMSTSTISQVWNSKIGKITTRRDVPYLQRTPVGREREHTLLNPVSRFGTGRELHHISALGHSTPYTWPENRLRYSTLTSGCRFSRPLDYTIPQEAASVTGPTRFITDRGTPGTNHSQYTTSTPPPPNARGDRTTHCPTIWLRRHGVMLHAVLSSHCTGLGVPRGSALGNSAVYRSN